MTALVLVLLVLVTFNSVLLVLVTDRMVTFKVLFWSSLQSHKYECDTECSGKFCSLNDHLFLCRILTDMRIIAADWMGNSSEYNTGHVSKLREEGAGVPVTFRSRPAAPTAAQVLLASCMNLYVDVALD
jgi:hypothetical protein